MTVFPLSRKHCWERGLESAFSKNQSCAGSKHRTASAQFPHHKGPERSVGDSADWHLGCGSHLSITWPLHRRCTRLKARQHCEILYILWGSRHCYNIGSLPSARKKLIDRQTKQGKIYNLSRPFYRVWQTALDSATKLNLLSPFSRGSKCLRLQTFFQRLVNKLKDM